MALYEHDDGVKLPFPQSERCRARSKQQQRQCRNKVAGEGIRVCTMHGVNQRSKDKIERHVSVGKMRELVTPIDGADFEANPIAAFEMEFRRTVAAIRYYDEVLEHLDPENLGWGMSKKTDQASGEYPGVDTEFEAKPNVYYEMRMKERKHLLELIKVWIGAKLDVRKLEIEEQKVAALNEVIRKVITRLGHDVNDPEVRRTVRDTMLELPVAGTPQASLVATAKQILKDPKPLDTVATRNARKAATGHATTPH